MKTRDLALGKDGKYRLYVMCDARKLGLIANNNLKHVQDEMYTFPIEMCVLVTTTERYAKHALENHTYFGEWESNE